MCNHYLAQAVSGTLRCCTNLRQALGEDGYLTHADGVGGVQLAAVGAFAVEGPGHVSTRSVDARAGLALVDI